MAKKKLFGNQSEPRCDTCALGKLSSDQDTVLCRRNGAVPSDHQCRHFTYDPLKRIPRRMPLPQGFCAADFALDDPPPAEEWKSMMMARDTDNEHDELLHKLRDYLNETDAPDVQTIFDLLGEIPDLGMPTTTPSTEAVASDRTPPACDGESSDVSAPDDNGDASKDDAPASDEEEQLVPDETPDIFGDLERLIENASTGSTAAAFRDFDICTVADDGTDSDLIDSESLYTSDMLALVADDELDEDAPLNPNDLLLLAEEESPDSETVDALRMNEDGTFSVYQDTL